VICIYTFAGVVQNSVPEYAGPKLGNAIAPSKDTAREKKIANQTGGLSGTVDHASAGTHARDRTTGAADSGGPARPGEVSVTDGGATIESAGAEVDADAQGLDADLKKKMLAKLNPEEDDQVCAWIGAVTGEQKVGDQTTAEYLKSGTVLCALANKIRPNSVTGVSKNKMPFNQMENISKFLAAARAMGMAESSLFSTPDLFEEKNMSIVITALFNFGGVVQTKVPEFSGPHLGVAQKAEVNDTSRGIGLATDQTEAMQAAMDKGETRLDGIIRG